MTVSTATVLAPAGGVLGTSLADIWPAVPAGYVHPLDIRYTNVGTADGYADLYMVDTNGVVTSHYRAKNYYIPYQQTSSAPDMEQRLVIPAGFKLQGKASATSTIGYSVTGVQDQA